MAHDELPFETSANVEGVLIWDKKESLWKELFELKALLQLCNFENFKSVRSAVRAGSRDSEIRDVFIYYKFGPKVKIKCTQIWIK